MKHTVNANVKFEIHIPTLEEINESDILKPYTKEEQWKQLLTDAVYQKLDNVSVEFYTYS